MPNVSPEQIGAYLIQRGVSQASAAGILSNIRAESSFNSSAVGDQGSSGGLFQHHASRWDGLKSFAASTGRSWEDWTAQVDFALQEAQQMGINLQQSDPGAAAYEWTVRFERPKNAQQRAQQRAAEAQSFMGAIGGTNLPTAFPAAAVAGGQTTGEAQFVNAFAQNQDKFFKELQRYNNELLGLQGRDINQQIRSNDLNIQYQEALAGVFQNVNQAQKIFNSREFKNITEKLGKLQNLQLRGIKQTHHFITSQGDLQRDIFKATKKWLGKQREFTQRDFQIIMSSVARAMATEAAKFAEIRRATGRERTLAKQERDFTMQTAAAERGQSLKESAFKLNRQKRANFSDAIKRGAVTAPGTAQNVREFQRERQLANQQARINFQDINRQSLSQLRRSLESINQAARAGRISFQDAQRQARTARKRAALERNQGMAQIGFQGQQAHQQLRGTQLERTNRWRQAHQQFSTNMANLQAERAGARLSHNKSAKQLWANARELALTTRLHRQQADESYQGLTRAIDRANIEAEREHVNLGQQVSQTRINQIRDLGSLAAQERSAANQALQGLSPYR